MIARSLICFALTAFAMNAVSATQEDKNYASGKLADATERAQTIEAKLDQAKAEVRELNEELQTVQQEVEAWRQIVNIQSGDDPGSQAAGNSGSKPWVNPMAGAAMVNKIDRNWRVPATARKGMEVVLLVSFRQPGIVKEVSITKGSGNASFDSSVVQAVHRAERFDDVGISGIDEIEVRFVSDVGW